MKEVKVLCFNPHVEEVIISNQEERGKGTLQNPYRRVIQVFTKKGIMIAENDKMMEEAIGIKNDCIKKSEDFMREMIRMVHNGQGLAEIVRDLKSELQKFKGQQIDYALGYGGFDFIIEKSKVNE